MVKDFDLTISREKLSEIAPALIDALREFTTYGFCRQANTWERKACAEKFAELAKTTLKQFPDLKLNHVGAKTIVVESA